MPLLKLTEVGCKSTVWVVVLGESAGVLGPESVSTGLCGIFCGKLVWLKRYIPIPRAIKTALSEEIKIFLLLVKKV